MICRSVCSIRKRIYLQLIFVLLTLIILQMFGVFTHLFEKDFYEDFHYPYDGDISESVEQLRHNQVPDIQPINYYNFTFLKNCSRKCKVENELRLIYLIKSAPENVEHRIAIRSTWGYERRFSDVEIRTVFVIGVRNDEHLQQSIDEESKHFNDVVQVNFTDSYFNNTIKTMMAFKWAVMFCPQAKFYMFVDDDYYVSTRNVLRYLRNPTNYPQYLQEPMASLKKLVSRKTLVDYELPEDVQLYTGYVFTSSPHRHFTSKWKVSLEEYPYHLWPPYVTAGSYILSKNALLLMYFTSFYTKHFRFDDIYVGLLAYKAKIEPYHCDHFYFYKKQYAPQDYEFVIASHGYGDPDELLKVWTNQRSLGNA